MKNEAGRQAGIMVEGGERVRGRQPTMTTTTTKINQPRFDETTSHDESQRVDGTCARRSSRQGADATLPTRIRQGIDARSAGKADRQDDEQRRRATTSNDMTTTKTFIDDANDGAGTSAGPGASKNRALSELANDASAVSIRQPRVGISMIPMVMVVGMWFFLGFVTLCDMRVALRRV